MSEDDEIHLSSGAFEPNRERVTIDIGALVQRGNVVYRIAEVLDFESIIGVAVETGRSVPLRINDLRPLAGARDAKLPLTQDLAEIADNDWQIAQQASLQSALLSASFKSAETRQSAGRKRSMSILPPSIDGCSATRPTAQ